MNGATSVGAAQDMQTVVIVGVSERGADVSGDTLNRGRDRQPRR